MCQFACNPVRDDLFLLDTTNSTKLPAPPSGPTAGAHAAAPDAAPAQAGASAPGTMSSGNSPQRNPAVHFDWTESIPGAGACQASRLTGRFYCSVDTILGNPEQLNGSISLVLRGSSEAQTLNIDGGQISAYDENMNPVVLATVGGSLECDTQRLVANLDPTPSDVMPIDRQIAWVNFNVQPTTTGTLKGSLDPALQEVNGDLELDFEPNTRCIGEFQLRAWAIE